jgi:hypothetical protein
MKRLLIILTVLAFVGHTSAQSEKLTKKEERAELKVKGFEITKNLLESKQFKFIGSFNNTNNNVVSHGIEISGNKAVINLPFFGQEYSNTSYGAQESGFSFDGEIEGYDLKIDDKKKKFRLKIVTKDKSERVTYSFDIDAFGVAYVSAISDKRSVSTYDGRLKPLEPKP